MWNWNGWYFGPYPSESQQEDQKEESVKGGAFDFTFAEVESTSNAFNWTAICFSL